MAVQYAFGKIITQGLDLNVDAADPTSYPGSGTSWTNVVNRSITGSIISCSFSSDYKGGLVFNNPSASVVFPGTLANYGTGSFTVEMAFRPTQINGIHYLVSKNSGSFPNWGVYLSGSGGSGKLFAEYRISSTVSCSVSSSTVLTTSSAYQTDVTFNPITTTIVISLDGAYDVVSPRGNGTGSLGTTGSLFVGNTTFSSSLAYSGSILNNKIYSIETSGYSNYKTVTPRFSKPIPNRPPKMQVLVVAGGGGGHGKYGGGGAGGLRYTFPDTTPGLYNVFVGDGGNGVSNSVASGSNGQNSFFGSVIATGGGGGGAVSGQGGSGGSGGGGGAGSTNSGSGNIPATEPPQGFDGGGGGDGVAGAGGGGGAGQKGFNAGTNPGGRSGGNGGAGLAFSITGITTYYAGGGGGGSSGPTEGGQSLSTGGIGGGGDGRSGLSGGANGGSGSANTGGGGGAGYNSIGGKGGSGIVVVRYPGPPIATGGTITSVGGDTIHTFTATGSYTFTIF